MKDTFVLHKDKLKGEYLEAFDKVELYGLVSSSIREERYEDCMMNLLDMLLTAQENGKPVGKIIGNDIESFCKSYFEGYSFRENVRNLPKIIIRVAWLIFIIEMLDLMIALTSGDSESGAAFFGIKTDLGPYLLGLLFGSVVLELVAAAIKPFVFRIKWLSAAKVEWFLFLIMVGGLLVLFLSDMDLTLETPLWLVLLISGAYIAVYYSVTAYLNHKKYGSLRKPKDTTKISFWQQVHESVDRELPGELKKRYEKTNRKRAKKGKPLMTPEEYMAVLRKEAKWDKTGNFWGAVFGSGFVFGLCGGMLEGFESIADGVIFLVFLVLVEAAMWYWYAKSGKKKGHKVLLLEKCDELGITVLEYADGLENGTIKFERDE